MKKYSKFTYLIISLFFFTCSSNSQLTSSDYSKKLHILFIGNSLTYSNDLRGMLEKLFQNTEVEDLKIESISRPSYGLQDHWDRNIALNKISEGEWDIVVMQQGPSATEGRPSLLEYSQKFSKKIRKTGGIPALYMVWPSQRRFFDFDGVSDSYQSAAGLVDGLLFPAGEAWRLAWQKDASLKLYGIDGFHPSLLGSYLAALVMFNRLSDYDILKLPASIPSKIRFTAIPADQAKILKEAAIKANEQF